MHAKVGKSLLDIYPFLEVILVTLLWDIFHLENILCYEPNTKIAQKLQNKYSMTW